MSDISAGAAASAPAPSSTPSEAGAPEGAEFDAFDAGAEGEIEAEALPEPVTKSPPPSSKKKFQLKVDGRDEDFELDLANEEEIRKHLQFSKAAQKRMQESAEMRKGVNELLEALRTDPIKVLTDPRLQIPEDVRRQLAESIISEEMEELTKSPEQKEKEKLQREYERLKAEVETEKKARSDAEFARLQEQQAVQLDKEMSEAIESSGLPKNARTVRYMAEALMFCLQNDLDLSAKDLVPYVKKQTLGEFKEMISSLSDDDFEDWLGKDQISRLRKRNIQRAKAGTTAAAIKPTGANTPKSDTKQEKISFKDFMKGLGK
jgi:hypothetical protein